MVAAHHLIWTVYGWWLANDPRGSSSRELPVAQLSELGPLHYGRKAVQPSRDKLQAYYDKAQPLLQHQIILFTDAEIAFLGEIVGKSIQDNKYTCYACAIMPEHIHMVIRRHKDSGKEMIAKLQTATRTALIEAQLRHCMHPVWGGPGWDVFLNTCEDIQGRIRYVDLNPEKAGRPR